MDLLYDLGEDNSVVKTSEFADVGTGIAFECILDTVDGV